uniref:Kunitz-type serine protease inhibitor homolog calcicludine n=1 Tax=Dendroaspis angusticeps TaxID=8618 RepID=UPI001292CCD8
WQPPWYAKEPVRIGSCKKQFSSFYFKWTAKKCLPFLFSGCGGNANRFQTIGECRKKCLGK